MKAAVRSLAFFTFLELAEAGYHPAIMIAVMSAAAMHVSAAIAVVVAAGAPVARVHVVPVVAGSIGAHTIARSGLVGIVAGVVPIDSRVAVRAGLPRVIAVDARLGGRAGSRLAVGPVDAVLVGRIAIGACLIVGAIDTRLPRRVAVGSGLTRGWVRPRLVCSAWGACIGVSRRPRLVIGPVDAGLPRRVVIRSRLACWAGLSYRTVRGARLIGCSGVTGGAARSCLRGGIVTRLTYASARRLPIGSLGDQVDRSPNGKGQTECP